MAKWMPPIPKGALWSQPVRDLGPAAALLAYCYDLVKRDGWLDIVLKDTADDMQEPYPNVKRWWGMLRAGPFFCETIDRGRHGWRVRFRDTWIEWRILESRPNGDPFSRTDEVSEMIPQSDEVHFKSISSPFEGSEMILQNSVYGTHDSDQADLLPPPPTQPPRVGGGGGSEQQPTETQVALLAFGFSAPSARRFRDLPLDVVRAELKAARARGSGAGSLVDAWKVSPPTAARASPDLPAAYYAAPPPAPTADPLSPERLQELRKQRLEARYATPDPPAAAGAAAGPPDRRR